MPIAHGLTTTQIGQVQSLVDQGKYADAWAQLAQWGDSYADNAADVTGTPTSTYGEVMHELVKEHWDNTAGPGAYEQHFTEVAHEHLQNYLNLMSSGNWPDTQQIEASYKQAVLDANLPETTAIDGVITQSVGESTGGWIDWPLGLGIESGRISPSTVFSDVDRAQAWKILQRDIIGTMGAFKGQGEQKIKEMFDALKNGFGKFFDSAEQKILDEYRKLLEKTGDVDDIIKKITDLFAAAEHNSSPLILDLDGDGVETLNVQDGIHFDHDANGFAEQTGWVGKDDGLLVRDLNGNGSIDSGRELFGNNTQLANASYADNGFSALADLDSNHDGKLSSADSAFSQLRIWKDANSNGITDAGELLTLSAAGVQSIATGYSSLISIDVNGNEHQQAGTYTTTTNVTRSVDDVWFIDDLANTVNTTTVAVSAEVEALPEIAGFGNVPSLHQAMMLDTSGHLRSLVQAFAGENDSAARASILAQIIYSWTGVENIDPHSRGQYVADARTVYVVEAFMGQTFIQGSTGSSSPGPFAAADLQKAFDQLSAYVKGQLMLQTNLAPFFDSLSIAWSADGSTLAWDVSAVVAQLHAAYDVNAAYGSSLIKDFVASLKTQGSTRESIIAALRSAGNVDTPGFLHDLSVVSTDSVTDGTATADTLGGTSASDLVLGRSGNDVIYGGMGNDVLDGGAGDDLLSGDAGSDTYLFGHGSGHDTINNFDQSTARFDVLEFNTGVNESDVQFTRSGNDLVITIAGTSDQITVVNYFLNGTAAGYALDAVRFSNGTTWDRATINNLFAVSNGSAGADALSALLTGSSLHGLAGNDTLQGNASADQLHGDDGDDVISAAGGNDTLEGGNGADTLYGGSGNDVLNGGAGDDQLWGDSGSDIYIFGRGDGQDTINNYDPASNRNDVLQFKAGVAVGDVQATRLADHLVLKIVGTTDQITVNYFFTNDGINEQALSAIKFDDGAVWDIEAIIALVQQGTDGTDELYAYSNGSTLHGLNGDDTLHGGVGNDVLDGGEGRDYLDAGAGDDVLTGDNGDDVLDGWDGNDILDGGAGADQLVGRAGNDTFIGGSGADSLDGGAGNDIYQFGRGAGDDKVYETSGSDQIKLDAGILTSDVGLYRVGDDLIVVIDNSPTQMKVVGQFSSPNGSNEKSIESILFSDGTTWDASYINSHAWVGSQNNKVGSVYVDDTYVVDNTNDGVAEFESGVYGYQISESTDTVQSWVPYTLGRGIDNLYLFGVLNISGTGNDLNNIIVGNTGDNVVTGGKGRDFLSGGQGSDTYKIDAGDGIDLIDNYATDSESTIDTLIWSGISPTSIAFTRVGDTLVMTSGTDVVGISNYFGAGNAAYRVDQIVFSTSEIQWSADDLWAHTSSLAAPYTAGNDVVSGSVLDDLLDGGAGADTMSGGDGNDVYLVDNVNDVVVEDLGAYQKPVDKTSVIVFRDAHYVDMVRASVSYGLSANVENLVLTGGSAISGTGNELDNQIIGNSASNTLWGLDGNDRLDGSGGADTMVGGLGQDTYVVDDVNDVVVENLDEGWDRVESTVSYVLGANVDVIALLGTASLSATGNDANNYLYGNSGANHLVGGGGDDRLEGGAGADIMEGGTGNDYYLIEDSGDVVIENQGEGDDDSIDTFVSYALASGSGVERLSAAGRGITITGNDGANYLYTQESGNTLDGGAGNDTLRTLTYTDTRYVFGHGYGQDTIDSWGGVIAFKPDVSVSDVSVRRIGSDLVFGLAGTTDNVTALWATNNFTATFSDGTVWSGDQINALADGYVNHAPTLTTGLADRNVETAVGFSFSVASGWYVDADAAEKFTYSATLENGATLPSWLVFDGSAGTFSGTPSASNLGSVNVAVTVTDSAGSAISDVFTLTVADPNLVLTGTSANDILTGKSGNDTLDGGLGADQMSGKKGNDTYVVDNAGDVVTEASNEGTDTVQSSVTYTLGSNVENLVLTGASAINGTGNSLTNSITGNSSANTLNGGSGADQLAGGAGNDTYVVDNVGDVVVENANEGTDLVQAAVTYTLSANVENLTLTGTTAINGTGNSLDNVLTGNSANNTLTGAGGNDTLSGGAGADTMLGGIGDDTYVVDSTSDVVTENANEGTDLVQSSVTYTIGSNVENLTLTGTSAINGTGTTLANVIIGNSANNTLDGGAGIDTLIGGAGNDTYVVDNAGDIVTENASEGSDLIRASISYALGANVENLTLTGTGAINATGNALANTLTGNSGNNVLDGGVGADTMVGGAGNDTYVVDNTSDIVTEAASAGTDLVQASVTYTLATNVENLTLTGTSAINGTGNTLANVLTGNSADNTLNGAAGADTLIGGLGNDTYVVDNTGDAITENASEGTDLIQASVTYTLVSNVENLTLTGTTAINGTGNTLDNIVTGNSAANTLTGGAGNDTLDGGTGTDTMVGGAGNDVYYVNVSADVTTENANEGIDTVNSGVTRTLAANIEALFLTGTNAINGTGNTLNNLLRGNAANNTLAGGGGADILEGGAGNDILSNTSGNTFLNGGAGTDTLTGTANNDLLIGGAGNDALTTGQGADIIAFNKGDGQDTVAASTTKDNTLSIGGGTAYADLLFQKSGNDLILKVGASDQITFTGYYASTSNHSVNTLQVILEGSSDYNAGSSSAMYNKKIESFNFDGLVSAFDAARTANPSLTTWALSGALAAQYLSGSDTAAMGGDLAYQYGRFGNEANVSYTPAMGVLGSASFGTAAQTLQSLTSLQDASPRLS